MLPISTPQSARPRSTSSVRSRCAVGTGPSFIRRRVYRCTRGGGLAYARGMRFQPGVAIAMCCAFFTACGPGGGGGGSDAATAGDAAVEDAAAIDGPPVCNDGDPCDAGVCAGNVCCAAERACGTTCCDGAQVCSFQTCVTPGNLCVDATDCAP